MRSPYILALPIALATITVMLATDLYLPAVPTLHESLGGTAVAGQYTLASFIAAFAVGQLIVGALADRHDKRLIMIVSLALFTVVSLLCATVDDMTSMIVLRALQGFVSAAGVALAPAMIRELGDQMTTIKLIGFISSVEAVIPALAPALGAWLIALHGWEVTFFAVSAIGLIVTAVFLVVPPTGPSAAPTALAHPVLVYARLFTAKRFMVFTLGHAFGIGALMTFIFAAPYILTTVYGRDMTSFLWMQAFLIGSFMISANMGGVLSKWIGVPGAIMVGSLIQWAGGFGLLGLALLHAAPSTALLTVAMIPVNAGLGLRAGATFTRAMEGSNAPNGSTGALMITLISVVMSAGTAVVAPYLHLGLWPVAAAVLAQLTASLALLAFGNAAAAAVEVEAMPMEAVKAVG